MSKRKEIDETVFDAYLNNCAKILGQNEGGWTFRTHSGKIVSQEYDGIRYRYFLILL